MPSQHQPVTRRQLRAIEKELDVVLDSIECTTYADVEPMFLIIAPTCDYCGRINPRTHCRMCGAPGPGVVYPMED